MGDHEPPLLIQTTGLLLTMEDILIVVAMAPDNFVAWALGAGAFTLAANTVVSEWSSRHIGRQKHLAAAGNVDLTRHHGPPRLLWVMIAMYVSEDLVLLAVFQPSHLTAWAIGLALYNLVAILLIVSWIDRYARKQVQKASRKAGRAG